MNKNGFTLIELLTVIAMIGILGAITFPFAKTMMLRQQMAEARSQVMKDIQEVRSASIKTSRNGTISFKSSTPNQYTVKIWNSKTKKMDSKVKTLPNNAVILLDKDGSIAAGDEEILYKAPYGEVSIDNRSLVVALKDNNDEKLFQRFYVVGVTGQVHQ